MLDERDDEPLLRELDERELPPEREDELRELDEPDRERELPPEREDEPPLRERDDDERELLDELRRDDDERRDDDAERRSRAGISSWATAFTSCGMSFSRNFAMRSSSRRIDFAIRAVEARRCSTMVCATERSMVRRNIVRVETTGWPPSSNAAWATPPTADPWRAASSGPRRCRP